MSPVDAALVRRKLTLISRNLIALEPIAGLSLDACRADRFRHKGTERMLRELIEAAVDTNLHLLRSRRIPTPGDYFGSFIELGRAGVISSQLADQLAPASGLRNRLVHEYDVIDDEIVLQSLRDALQLFPRYVAAVEQYVSRNV